jgi:hypothetical protein
MTEPPRDFPSAPRPEWAKYARHLPNCAIRLASHPCGAARGRHGKCPKRATRRWTQESPSLSGGSRFVRYYRCDEHPVRRHVSSDLLSATPPCTCGLADLLLKGEQIPPLCSEQFDVR